MVLMVMAAPVWAQCPDGTPPPCPGGPGPRAPRIQVAGFTPAGGDTGLAYIADALTDDVIASLRSAGGVTVLSARAARGSADYQLSGRVGGTREGVTVSARLERANGQVAWAASRERLRRDLPATAGDLTRELLQSIGQRAAPAAAQRTVDPRAFDLVMRGRYHLARRTIASVARATELFRQAALLDSASALGWAWYARAVFYARRWGYPVAGVAPESTLAAEVAAADRAIEREPDNPAVLVMRALVSQDITPGSRAACLAALRRAVAIDPRFYDAWRIMGQVLEEVGDSAGAIESLRRAVTLAPDDAESLMWLSLHHFWHRNYPEAVRWADSAVAADPLLTVAQAGAAQAFFWSGRFGEAQSHVTALAGLGSQQDLIGAAIGVRLALVRGDSAAARAALAALRELAGPRPALHAALGLADGLAALGDTQQALDVLENFPVRVEMHFQMHLRLEPGLGPLRSLPRFQQLLVAPRP